ncbi:sortilin-related receptor isoform X1 [Lates japonicus]|uniref:Sortilin-related receptor isoform X1 n=1 Tax=Lates japonicus TaxID=270547 RepID=A0AAD3MFK5_LATJO|nr:sortilin-related receptor isoform X1 [Lates japonicus]
MQMRFPHGDGGAAAPALSLADRSTSDGGSDTGTNPQHQTAGALDQNWMPKRLPTHPGPVLTDTKTSPAPTQQHLCQDASRISKLIHKTRTNDSW